MLCKISAILFILATGAFPVAALAATEQSDAETAPTFSSELISLDDGELILKQTIVLDVSLEQAWDLFTEADQISRWMAPVAKAEVRPGGTIRTHYDACAAIGDAGTITLDIVNFIPHQLLTLQSSLDAARGANWMNEAILDREDDLFNVIEFEAISPSATLITSWGLGYRDDPEWEAMLGFFTAGNEWSYAQLHRAVRGEEVWPPCSE